MNATKQVGYAYPTSDTAGRFGFGKDGCYFVLFLAYDTGKQKRFNSNRSRGFATLESAFNYADQQPEAYDRYSLRRDGSRPWMGVAP